MSGESINPYEVLGVNKSASQEEIKAAHRRLVKVFHPDVTDGFEEHIKRVNLAFSMIGTPENKERYDRDQRFSARTSSSEETPTEQPQPQQKPRRNYREEGYSFDPYSYVEKDAPDVQAETSAIKIRYHYWPRTVLHAVVGSLVVILAVALIPWTVIVLPVTISGTCFVGMKKMQNMYPYVVPRMYAERFLTVMGIILSIVFIFIPIYNLIDNAT